jgi:hypothetical protein
MMNWRGLYGSDYGLVKILSWSLAGETKENHKNPQLG